MSLKIKNVHLMMAPDKSKKKKCDVSVTKCHCHPLQDHECPYNISAKMAAKSEHPVIVRKSEIPISKT